MLTPLRSKSLITVSACFALLLLVMPAAPVKDNGMLNLERWTQELADDQYSVREKATAELWKMGTSALPKLRELTRSRDPEQAVRARELVRKIEMGVFPDSDPELLAIVAKYPDAMPSEKSTLIRELQNRRAWRQMLKLYQEETNATVIKQYLTTMQRIAVYAAREKLSKGDEVDALELLKLAPKTPDSLLAMAHFHRVRGDIDQQLQMANERDDEDAAAWRAALHRAQGDMKGALAHIDADKHPELAAALAALDGNPLPWLQMRSSVPEEERSRRLSHQSRSLYARLSSDRWNGEEMNPADLGKLKEMLENRSSQYRRVARTALFMLNAHEAAEESLIKDSPMMAVHYLLMMERVEEALRILGHDTKTPCTEKWVREQLENLDEDDLDDFEDSKNAQSLCVMAGFLEARGLHELAHQCFKDPLLELAQKDKSSFLDFMMKLFNENTGFQPAPRLAIRISLDWAGDDEGRWESLTDAFWSGDDDSHEWWKMLAKIDPEASREKRLELVLILSRRLPGPNGERQKWQDLAWKHYQKTKGEEQDDVLRRLVDLAFNTGDVELGEKVWPIMPEDMRNSYFWRQQISHLSAREKWDDVCVVLLKQVKMMEEKESGSINPAFHAYAASALRRAGRVKEAKKHDYMADLLCLGDHQMAMQIALAYAFGEDYERSRQWWERAAQAAPPSGSSFAMAISAYADSLQFEPSGWHLVASLNEVACCESIDGSYYELDVPLRSMRLRLKADTYRGLSKLKHDRRSGLSVLEQCHDTYTTDGALADFFFPALRQADLIEEHDRWFAESWKRFSSVIKSFPACANSRNTAAWFASRAQRELAEAETHLREALKEFPEQPAYLDTMAEIQFAKGKRKDAVKWSSKAILLAPTDTELRKQHHHFRHDPMPK